MNRYITNVPCIGDKFESFEKMKETLTQYASQNYFTIWIKESRKLNSVKRRLDRNMKQDLVYYEITYCCSQGGRKVFIF